MSFVVRKVSYHANPSSDKQDTQVSVEPNKVLFDHLEHNRINIVKLSIKNLNLYEIGFSIIQPKEPYLRVRYQKTSIPPSSSCEIFIFLNPQSITKAVNDQFVIFISKELSIYVPIQINAGPAPVYKAKRSTLFTTNLKEIQMNKVGVKRAGRQGRKNGAIHQQDVVNEMEQLIELFLGKYKKIEGFLKEKTIKNQIFIGEKPITIEKRLKIENFNLRMEYLAEDQEKLRMLSRHRQECSGEGPSIQHLKQVKPRWDVSRNDDRITLKKAMGKFVEEVRKIVVSYRFKKMHRVMQIYRQLDEELDTLQIQSIIIPNLGEQEEEQTKIRSSLRIKSSLEHRENNEDEWIKKQEYLCHKIQKNILNKANCKLAVDFNEFTLVPRLLEQDHNTSTIRKDFIYDIKPMVGFDNWVSLDESIPYAHELQGYQVAEPLNIWESYPPASHDNQRDSHSGPSTLMRVCLPEPERQEHVQALFEQFEQGECLQAHAYASYGRDEALERNLQMDDLVKQELSKLTREYSSGIKTVNYHQQCFQSFHVLRPRGILGPCALPPARLIHHPSREDKVDFDELSNLQKNKIKRLKTNEWDEQRQRADELLRRECEKKKGEQFCEFYERLLENIEKIKLRKLNTSFNRIMWLGRLTKSNHHLIYL